MWRLWHRLFGWDYVMVEFAGSGRVVRTKQICETGYIVICGQYYILNKDKTAAAGFYSMRPKACWPKQISFEPLTFTLEIE